MFAIWEVVFLATLDFASADVIDVMSGLEMFEIFAWKK